MSNSSYAFSAPSKEVIEKYKGLALKEARVATPVGRLTPEELAELKPDTLEYGPYVGHDEIMGKIVYWHLPMFDQQGCENLAFAITNLHRYQELRETYKALIKKDPLVRWQLIFVLLCEEHIKDGLPPLKVLPTWKTPALLKNKELFRSLVEDGALYKHYLANAYQVIDEDLVPQIFELFGKDAAVPLQDDLDLLMNHFLEEDFTTIDALLKGGVDINNRVDSIFGNTALHYLIALEDVLGAINLIDRMCEYQKEANNTVKDIDYTLQDKQGKTPLLFAVGLGLEPVIDRLLELAAAGKDIGLNAPDKAGRTPLMIAAALGYGTIRDKLVAHGADQTAKDNQQRNVAWYANAPLEVIKEILQSVSVNPDRGAYCKLHSYLYSNTSEAIPLVLIDKNDQPHLLLRSAKKEYLELLHLALIVTESKPAARAWIFKQMAPLMPEAGPDYNKSIAEVRKEKQVENNAEFIARLGQAQAQGLRVAHAITLGFMETGQQSSAEEHVSVELNKLSMNQAPAEFKRSSSPT